MSVRLEVLRHHVDNPKLHPPPRTIAPTINIRQHHTFNIMMTCSSCSRLMNIPAVEHNHMHDRRAFDRLAHCADRVLRTLFSAGWALQAPSRIPQTSITSPPPNCAWCHTSTRELRSAFQALLSPTVEPSQPSQTGDKTSAAHFRAGALPVLSCLSCCRDALHRYASLRPRCTCLCSRSHNEQAARAAQTQPLPSCLSLVVPH